MMKPEEKISKAEEIIENAVWESRENEDWEWELAEYRRAEEILTRLEDSSDETELNRKRVLSYCLMRIDEALVKLERNEGAIKRAQESLDLALASGDSIQIARSKLMLGIRLLNEGNLPAAESHFGDIIKESLDCEDLEMQKVVGWTLLVRANILKGKSLYNQALLVAQDAVSVLSGIDNYAGLSQVYSLISRLHYDMGNPDDAEEALDVSKGFEEKAKKYRQ